MDTTNWFELIDANVRRIIGWPLMSIPGEIAHATQQSLQAAEHDLALCHSKLVPGLGEMDDPKRLAAVKRVLAKAQTSALRNCDAASLSKRLCLQQEATAVEESTT